MPPSLLPNFGCNPHALTAATAAGLAGYAVAGKNLDSQLQAYMIAWAALLAVAAGVSVQLVRRQPPGQGEWLGQPVRARPRPIRATEM